MEIGLLVFDRPPETLDKDVVKDPVSDVHADPDTIFLQQLGKLMAGKLAALIGVEDLRLRYLEGLLQGRETECSIQGG